MFEVSLAAPCWDDVSLDGGAHCVSAVFDIQSRVKQGQQFHEHLKLTLPQKAAVLLPLSLAACSAHPVPLESLPAGVFVWL